MRARENAVVDRIRDGLKKEAARRKEPIQIRKRHGTAFGVAGDPDLYGIAAGKHFEIEVKSPGEKPTPLQLVRIAEWRAAGAHAGWATSLEEALEIVWPRSN